MLRLGIHTPIVIQTPRGHAKWEETATVADLGRVVSAADRLGYHHLTCSEHIGIPLSEAGRRGDVYWDALATLSWAAAATDQIRLATNVLVLGYHHPVELLKRYGTLDRLSGGRVILGVGVGTLREEFDLLGAPFAERGARADEALAALVAGWGRPMVEHHGQWYDFGPLAVQPHAPRPEIDLWVGGSTRRSLRRALEVGSGWTPFALRKEALSEMLRSVEVPEHFDVILTPYRPVDPSGDPDGARAALDDLAEVGVTVVHTTFVHHSAHHYVEQLEALAELVAHS